MELHHRGRAAVNERPDDLPAVVRALGQLVRSRLEDVLQVPRQPPQAAHSLLTLPSLSSGFASSSVSFTFSP